MREISSIQQRRSVDLSLRAWVTVIVLGLETALILAVLLVIASRLGSIETGEKEMVRSRGELQELEKTRYDAQMQQLHRLEVSFNTMAAWYQEDVRRQDDLRLQLVQGKK